MFGNFFRNRDNDYPDHSPMYKDSKMTEYMCTHCGAKISHHSDCGRPSPGRCPRRSNGQPHRWVVNRKY